MTGGTYRVHGRLDQARQANLNMILNLIMKTSVAGVEFVVRHEGWVDHSYKNVAGTDAIGYGHVLNTGENLPPVITKEKGLELLGLDLFIAEFAVGRSAKGAITQNQFDAMVSFTFNVGENAFATSTLLKLLNAGDVQGAADEFLKWNHVMINDVKTVHPGLTRRRREERAVFLKPEKVVISEPASPPVIFMPPPSPPPDPPVAPPSAPIVLAPVSM